MPQNKSKLKKVKIYIKIPQKNLITTPKIPSCLSLVGLRRVPTSQDRALPARLPSPGRILGHCHLECCCRGLQVGGCIEFLCAICFRIPMVQGK